MIAVVFFLMGIIFIISDFYPETLRNTGTAVEKVIPVILTNAITLWLLSIVLSILWTFYNRMKQAETERLSAQIASLKSQIIPPFQLIQ